MRARLGRRGSACSTPPKPSNPSRRWGGLVGSFGDFRINAYNFETGTWLGNLRRPNGDSIAINGPCGLRFGNGVDGGRNDLLFSAGINNEADGLLGMIRHVG